MIKRSALTVVIVVVLLLLALLAYRESTSKPEIHLSDGFQTFPTPRTFDGPGTVFRLSHDLTKFPVTKLNVPVEEAGQERFPNFTKTIEWTFSAFLNFLGAQNWLTDPRLSTNIGSTLELSLRIGEGYRARTYDTDIDARLKTAGINFREDSKYYVIRETIAVSDLSYRVARKQGWNSEITAAIKSAAQLKGDLKMGSSDIIEFIQKFDKPYRVFYTTDEILRPTFALPIERLERRRVTEPLQWVNEAS